MWTPRSWCTAPRQLSSGFSGGAHGGGARTMMAAAAATQQRAMPAAPAASASWKPRPIRAQPPQPLDRVQAQVVPLPKPHETPRLPHELFVYANEQRFFGMAANAASVFQLAFWGMFGYNMYNGHDVAPGAVDTLKYVMLGAGLVFPFAVTLFSSRYVRRLYLTDGGATCVIDTFSYLPWQRTVRLPYSSMFANQSLTVPGYLASTTLLRLSSSQRRLPFLLDRSGVFQNAAHFDTLFFRRPA